MIEVFEHTCWRTALNPRTSRMARAALVIWWTALAGCRPKPPEVPVSEVNSTPISAGGVIQQRGAAYSGAYLIPRDASFYLCAEPPADVAKRNESSRETKAAVELQAKIKAYEVAAKGSGESKLSAVSDVATAYTRTELVTLLRDLSYRICELSVNGFLEKEDVRALMNQLIVTARLFGQRDNVRELIGLVETLAKYANPLVNLLIADVMKSVRFLAIADQLATTPAADGAELVEKLLEQATSNETLATLSLLQQSIDKELERLRAEVKTLKDKTEKKQTELKISDYESARDVIGKLLVERSEALQ